MTDTKKQFIKAFSESGICLGAKCPFKAACDKRETHMPMVESQDWEAKICFETLSSYMVNNG